MLMRCVTINGIDAVTLFLAGEPAKAARAATIGCLLMRFFGWPVLADAGAICRSVLVIIRR